MSHNNPKCRLASSTSEFKVFHFPFSRFRHDLSSFSAANTCASAAARTAPLLSTRGASMPQCLRAHIPFPFADAGSSCEALSNPAPLTSLDEHRDLYKNRDRRQAEFHLI